MIPDKALNYFIHRGPCTEKSKERIFDYFDKTKDLNKRSKFVRSEYKHSGMGGFGKNKDDFQGYMAEKQGVTVKYIGDEGLVMEEFLLYTQLAIYIDKAINEGWYIDEKFKKCEVKKVEYEQLSFL